MYHLLRHKFKQTMSKPNILTRRKKEKKNRFRNIWIF